jgi:hypothetical protein
VGLEHRGEVPKGLKDKRSGPLPYGPARQAVLSLCHFEYRGHQVDDKTPQALALVTACVRLWTLSLP